MNYPVVLENVVKIYSHPMKVWEKVVSVNDLSFELPEGRVTGFVGHNGAGKTTTIKMIMGFITPTKGKISVLGKEPSDVISKKKIGFLPERPYFYTHLNSREFLSYFGSLSGLSRSDLDRLIPLTLKRVGLEDLGKRRLSSFSKGMLQRIGIAQAIIHDPDLVIMDEPMSGLDPIGRKEVKDVIASLRRDGKTVLFSSHILSDVEDLSDNVLVLSKGQKQYSGSLEALLERNISKYEIVFSAKNEGAVFNDFPKAEKLSKTYLLSFATDEEMSKALYELIAKKYTIINAGAVRPKLEEIVYGGEI